MPSLEAWGLSHCEHVVYPSTEHGAQSFQVHVTGPQVFGPWEFLTRVSLFQAELQVMGIKSWG